jgi:hypothetical protein
MMKKALGVVAVLVFLGVAYFLLREEFERPTPAQPATTIESAPVRLVMPPSPPVDKTREIPVAPAPTTPAVVLPPLAESDPFIRDELGPFALPPLWLKQDGLMQRFTVVVDAATRGEWPRRPLQFLKPEAAFAVTERDGRFYADPENAERFDSDLDMLEHIDPAAAARLLTTLDPLFEAALRNLGRPVNGRDVLLDAIDGVLAAPEPQGDPELVQPKVLYEYADPALENLPPMEKQLLRLGPENLRRLKTYLKHLRIELSRS